jgi:hypothetical protein
MNKTIQSKDLEKVKSPTAQANIIKKNLDATFADERNMAVLKRLTDK